MQLPGALNNRGLKSFPLLSGTKISSDLTGCNRAIGRGMMEFVEPAIVPGEIPQPAFKQSLFQKVTGRPVSVFVHREFPLSTNLILSFSKNALLPHQPAYSVQMGAVPEGVEMTDNIIRLD